MGLYGSGSTEFLKRALGHAGKNVHHGIETIFLRLIAERHDAKSVTEKFTVEKIVHEYELSDYVDETKGFAKEISKSVEFVSLKLNKKKKKM